MFIPLTQSAFLRKNRIRTEIVIEYDVLERVSHYEYLGCAIKKYQTKKKHSETGYKFVVVLDYPKEFHEYIKI